MNERARCVTKYRYYRHIALALVRQRGQLLLVRHRGPEGDANWWLPGGDVEQGEGLVAALRRELREETGLEMTGTPHVAFIVQVFGRAHDQVEESVGFHFACAVSGQLQPQDTDGLVAEAQWVDEADALARLRALGWYDCVPLDRWLNGEAATGAVYTHERRINVGDASEVYFE